MKFSDTTNRDAIIQQIEKATGTQSATTASYPLKVKTLDVNDALGNLFLLAIKAGGRFQVDDTSQADYPIITTDIVSSQQDYAFVNDGSSPANQILDLRQVRIKDSAGKWHVLTPIDREENDITQYEGVTGSPTNYDVDSNSIKLYPTPNYNGTASLELYISRTPVYFVSTDTTKEAGIPKLFQPYLWLRPSYWFCLIKSLPQAKGLQIEVEKMEKMIEAYYSRRDRTKGNGRFTTRQTGADSNR